MKKSELKQIIKEEIQTLLETEKLSIKVKNLIHKELIEIYKIYEDEGELEPGYMKNFEREYKKLNTKEDLLTFLDDRGLADADPIDKIISKYL